MPNLNIDVYSPGTDVTARATTPVAASTFVAVTGPMGSDRLITIGPAAPAGRVAGVAKYDAATGELVGLARGAARIVRVRAGAPLTAGTEVEVGAAGSAVPLAAGRAVGYTVDTAATGALTPISLYA